MIDHDTDSYEKISRAVVYVRPAGHLTRDRTLDNITLQHTCAKARPW